MARSARLVATGCLRTNSRLETTMQQKYCAQGRSTVVLTTTCPIFLVRSSWGSGGKAMKASISPSAKSRIDLSTGSVTHWMSRRGSRPTCPAMTERKMWRPDVNRVTATCLSLRSRIDRTRSLPNSSKHPMWSPDRMTIGSPASRPARCRPTNPPIKSVAPVAARLMSSCPPVPCTYWTSVNPSPRSSSSSATYSGARQTSGLRMSLTLVVSSGGWAATGRGPESTCAPPASPRLRRRSRRVIIFRLLHVHNIALERKVVASPLRLQARPQTRRRGNSRRRSAAGFPTKHPPSLPLQLLLELVEEAPVSALGNDLLRARLDHHGLVQAQREEAHGVLGVELPPFAPRNLSKGLERKVIARRVAAVNQHLGCPLRLERADRPRLQDCSGSPLSSNGIPSDKIAVRSDHAAEILGPGSVESGVDQDVADLPGTHLLGLGRKADERVDLALGQELHRLGAETHDPIDVFLWVHPHVGGHARDVSVLTRTQRRDCHGLASEITHGANPFRPEQLEAADVDPGEEDAWIAGIDALDPGKRRGVSHVNRARGEHLVGCDAIGNLHVLHIREALAFEERACNLGGRLADAGRPQHPEPCSFGGRLGLSRFRAQPDDPDRS